MKIDISTNLSHKYTSQNLIRIQKHNIIVLVPTIQVDSVKGLRSQGVEIQILCQTRINYWSMKSSPKYRLRRWPRFKGGPVPTEKTYFFAKGTLPVGCCP